MQCITEIAKESNDSPSLQREGHTTTAQLLLLYMLTTHKNSTTITIHANSLFKEGFHLIGLHSNSFSRSLYNTFLSLLFLEVFSSKMSALVIILVKQAFCYTCFAWLSHLCTYPVYSTLLTHSTYKRQ